MGLTRVLAISTPALFLVLETGSYRSDRLEFSKQLPHTTLKCRDPKSLAMSFAKRRCKSRSALPIAKGCPFATGQLELQDFHLLLGCL